MNVVLSEEERAKLGELYLRQQLLMNDMEKLNRLLRDTTLRIESELARIAKEKFGMENPDVARIRPVFREYRLEGLIVPDSWTKEEEDEPAS